MAKSKKDNKPKPVRAAGKKGAKAEAAKKATEEAPTPKSGPVGANVTDAELEKAIKGLMSEQKDLDEAQKEVKSINGRIRNKYKELKKKGVNTDALSFALKQNKLDDQGNNFMAWFAGRIAKVMNLPIGSQLSLLEPEKGGVDAGGSGKGLKEEAVPLTDTAGLLGKAAAHGAGIDAGRAAKPRFVPGKWKAYEADWLRGWEDGQRDNAAKLKGPTSKDSKPAPEFH